MASEEIKNKNAAVGAAILEEAKTNPQFRTQVQQILNSRLANSPEKYLADLDMNDHTETGD